MTMAIGFRLAGSVDGPGPPGSPREANRRAAVRFWIWLRLAESPIPRVVCRDDEEVRGITLHADRFGNLLTNIEVVDLPTPSFGIRFRGRSIPWVRTFGEARVGATVAYIGSGDRVELAVVQGSLSSRLGDSASAIGKAVVVRTTSQKRKQLRRPGSSLARFGPSGSRSQ